MRSVRALLTMSLTCLVVTASAAGAQQDIARLRTRLAAATARHTAAEHALRTYRDTSAARPQYADSATVLNGQITLLATADLVPVMREAVPRTDSLLRRLTAGTPSFDRTVAHLRTDTSRALRSSIVASYGSNGPDGQTRIIPRTADGIAGSVAEQLLGQVLLSLPDGFRKWNVGYLPKDSAVDAYYRAARIELASSPDPTARRCYDGAIDACHDLLVGEGNSAAISHYGYFPRSKAALVGTAVAIGGQGYVDRARQPATTASEVIAHMAKAPIDSVIAQWQMRVRTRGVHSEAFDGTIAALAAGWVIVLLFFALRSSRWR